MTTPFLDRLRRLGISPDGHVRSPGQTKAPMMSRVSLAPAPQASAGDRAIPSSLAPTVLRSEGGLHESRLVVGTLHGAVPLALTPEVATVAAIAARDPRFRDVPLEHFRFVDTETTSLAGGAGVHVFLVGVGRIEGNEVVVRQHFLGGPESESSFLRRVREDIGEHTVLVSFHGKSFDAPRMDDRYRLMGLDDLCRGRPHWDLLHPTRRLVRSERWPDVRLRRVESSWLSFERVDDLSGALCPTQYFHWLRGLPHRLPEVFEHNRLDILSLVALAQRLVEVYLRGHPQGCGLAAGLDLAGADPLRAEARLREGLRHSRFPTSTLLLGAFRAALKLGDRALAEGLAERFQRDYPDDGRGARLALRAARLGAPQKNGTERTKRLQESPRTRTILESRPALGLD